MSRTKLEAELEDWKEIRSPKENTADLSHEELAKLLIPSLKLCRSYEESEPEEKCIEHLVNLYTKAAQSCNLHYIGDQSWQLYGMGVEEKLVVENCRRRGFLVEKIWDEQLKCHKWIAKKNNDKDTCVENIIQRCNENGISNNWTRIKKRYFKEHNLELPTS